MKKVALITGASKGIGLALAKKMLAHNYIVIGTSTDGKNEHIQNDDFFNFQLNLSNHSNIQTTCKVINNQFKNINFLINNAGIGPDLDTLHSEINSFNKTFEVNVSGTVFFTEQLIPNIQNNGVILNFSSEMGAIQKCIRTDSVAYRMSKSALNMYTKILANRLKGTIKVVSIHPRLGKNNHCSR